MNQDKNQCSGCAVDQGTHKPAEALRPIGGHQQEALRLAHKYEAEGFVGEHKFAQNKWCRDAATELLHQHARIADLESRLSAIGAGGVEAPASPVSTYVEVRECSDCGHVGINDADKAACNTCEWYGDSPHEDKCPGCNRVGTMSAACPKCGSRTLLLAETHLLAAAPQAAPVAQGMCKNEWEDIRTLPTCDDLIWLYCQDSNTIDGPIAPEPNLEEYGWTHWAYANAPSTAWIDAAQAKQGGA